MKPHDNEVVVFKDFFSAGVGTPRLGYPFLLCLGKSLVVILDYALAT